MNPSTPALALDLRLRRGRFALSAKIELEAQARLALVGPNGSGKSTILSALAGILKPESGRIAFGQHAWFDSGSALDLSTPERPCALVFQNGALFPHLTTLENVAYGPRARGVTKDEAHDTARAWLARVQLADRADDRPHALSGGQARVVALVRALATEPGLLLLDEPFAGLDPVARQRASELVAEASSGFGGVLIWASHELRPLRAHTQQVVQIEAGVVHPALDWDSALSAPASQHLAAMVKAQGS